MLPLLTQRLGHPARWLATATLAALAFGACGRTPDPEETFVRGGPSGAGGAVVGTGGGSATGGQSFGGSGGTETLIDCGPPPQIEGAFSKRLLLEASARCAEWHYCSFENAATILERDVSEWTATPSEDTLVSAQRAWLGAMKTWSQAELYQFGPAGAKTDSSVGDPYHGQSYRDRIYYWPGSNRCRVEEQIASRRYATQGFEQVFATARGLYAIEYGLFYGGDDHACLPTSSTAETWATLSPAELSERKREYADAVSEDVLASIRDLRNLWDPAGGNFRQKLIDGTGYDKPAIGADQEALNVVAWSFVYVERHIKDWKVGYPAGLTPQAQVSGFEAPHAGVAVEALRANLEAARRIFQGCGEGYVGTGFDDWLTAAGHGDLAADIIAAFDGAQAAAAAFPAFDAASQQQFLALHAAIKPLSDLIKNEFMAGAGSPLNLSLPGGFEGDND